MKKLLFTGVVAASMELAACQVNNVRDTGCGAIFTVINSDWRHAR